MHPQQKEGKNTKLVKLAPVLCLKNNCLQGTTHPSYDVSKVLTASVGVNSDDHDKGESK